MDSIERNVPDPRHEMLELDKIGCQTSLVLVFEHKLCCGLLERSSGPDAVHLSLPFFFHQPCEVTFRFFKMTCLSALANSPPADAFVDMPDPTPEDEAGISLSSHLSAPF